MSRFNVTPAELETITREDFLAYVKVQKSGVTNMMMTSNVALLSRLSQEKVKGIMLNYDALCDQFPTD